MRVYLGSDHAGFELKARLAAHLTEQGHDVVDCGAHTFDAQDDYPPPCIAAVRSASSPASTLAGIPESGTTTICRSSHEM